MELHSISAPAITNLHTSISIRAVQSVDFLGLLFSNPNLSCRFNRRRPIRTKSKPIALASAFSNENDQAELDGFDGGTRKRDLRYENDESFHVSDVEVVGSVSEAEFVHSVELLERQGRVLDKLKAIQLHVLASEQWNASKLQLCHRNYLASATNLIHYLALRCLDVEELKDDLSLIGLLNLEAINSHVLASLTAIIRVLENMKSNTLNFDKNITGGIFSNKGLDQQKFAAYTVQKMKNIASSNRELLLGRPEAGRTTHIMVTVGEESTISETLITDLMKSGTSIFRINCAHGTPSIWSEIIKRVRESSQMLEKPCRVLMDLAGPKLRTGKLKPGPAAMKISPKKTDFGTLMSPAQVWLSHREVGPPPHLSLNANLYIDDQEFLTRIEVGDIVRFSDARGKKRRLKIAEKFHVFSGTGYVAECTRTAYVQSGTKLYLKGKNRRSFVGEVVDVPATEPYVRLRIGDLLIISRDSASQEHEPSVSTCGAHRITCSSGYLFDSVKPGEPIAFDDGKIWGTIQGTSLSEIVVSITHAGLKGTKLGSDKSINIPESIIRFEGLTSKDLVDLEFVAAHGDMLGVSFIRDTRDIVVLHQELEKRKLEKLGIVLKIETKSGFDRLPLLLLEAMKCANPLGVMIARGDLAVECGWEKLADMQEEIISLCGSANIPVIWATQVLESLVKSGVPTRAEITDAANGRRVSCIMMNKGKHIVEAVSTLDNILHSNSTKVKTDIKVDYTL
ncbi:plastidial pyruvate kinase 4, chloroplastic [Mercurialis annua]|uniref:plastidial pyruvate kinase 4, chloroplastic n=1 Tax=Mercurialis annua TaxID=3986 RepID=UPI002160D7E6|nr:plastidial pyruvate kinase 4, chloroplastic [Mercurialis annua]